MQRHFNKYGNVFDYRVLEVCCEQKLDERECFWIERWKTFHGGFNFTKGGRTSTKKPLRFSFENVKTKQILENVSIKEFLEITGIKGSVGELYEIGKGEMATFHKWKLKGKVIKFKKRNYNQCVPVKLLDISTGEIKEFPSKAEAARRLNVCYTSIRDLFKNRVKTCRGHILLT